MTQDKANAPSLDDEPIIELTDVIEDDEPIIELIDVVEEPVVVDVAAPAAGSSDEAGGTAVETPEIEEFSLMPDDMIDDLEADSQSRDLVQSLGMEIEPLADLPPATPVAAEPTPVAAPKAPAPVVQPPDVTAQVDAAQVEAALERIIAPMVAQRIDQILVEVIEKAVQREIVKIKAALLEEGSPDNP